MENDMLNEPQVQAATPSTFRVDGNPALSLFVGDNKSLTRSDRSFSTFEQRKSEIRSAAGLSHVGESQSRKTQQSTDRTQRYIFQMKYVPKHIEESDIVKKLEKFGRLKTFRLIVMSSEAQFKALGQSDAPNFRMAEFSFQDPEVERSVLTIKRIRVRGLQVKVSKSQSPAASFAAVGCDAHVQMSEKGTYDPFYHLKPTSKKYFSLWPERWNIMPREACNYRWNLRCRDR